jgi:hypothetical protein
VAAAASNDPATATGAIAEAFGTTLFFLTGTLTISFFSSSVIGSLVVTSFTSSSITGTTS